MAKGYQGSSPKDRSHDKMEKAMKRSKFAPKDEVPLHMRSIKEQLEYWENMSPEEKFRRKYGSYSTWVETVRTECSWPRTGWTDIVSRNKDLLRGLFVKMETPAHAKMVLIKKRIV